LPVYESPEDAEMAFYVAIENRDVDAMMDVWSGSDDVVCMPTVGSRSSRPVNPCVFA